MSENATIRIRHNRFDGFDIYTAEIKGKPKLLFHKPIEKTFIIAETFRYLGTNENMWLCENIHDGTINIAPFNKFTQLEKT